MEDFMAQVAWPGVQSSPVGGGEAPTAQELHPELEVTPEATPEETSEATEEGDGIVDADYVADMTTT